MHCLVTDSWMCHLPSIMNDELSGMDSATDYTCLYTAYRVILHTLWECEIFKMIAYRMTILSSFNRPQDSPQITPKKDKMKYSHNWLKNNRAKYLNSRLILTPHFDAIPNIEECICFTHVGPRGDGQWLPRVFDPSLADRVSKGDQSIKCVQFLQLFHMVVSVFF